MRRLVLAACVAAVAVVPSFAHASDGAYTGHVLFGEATGLAVGELENAILWGCDSSDPLNGTDNYMVALEPDDQGKQGTLDVTSGATGLEDFDVYFYDGGCNFIDGAEWNAEGPDHGTVPANAGFAAVNLYSGADAEFLLKITR